MVKVRLVEPVSGMLAAPNALMITGGATTVMLALEVFPVPPSVEVTCTLLFFTPAVVPVTFTVAVPPQVLDNPLGVATTRPAGRLSVKAIPVSAMVVFGFVMVKVNDVVPFKGMLAAPNALVMVGGEATTRFAEAVPPVPPLVELTAPVVLV